MPKPTKTLAHHSPTGVVGVDVEPSPVPTTGTMRPVLATIPAKPPMRLVHLFQLLEEEEATLATIQTPVIDSLWQLLTISLDPSHIRVIRQLTKVDSMLQGRQDRHATTTRRLLSSRILHLAGNLQVFSKDLLMLQMSKIKDKQTQLPNIIHTHTHHHICIVRT